MLCQNGHNILPGFPVLGKTLWKSFGGQRGKEPIYCLACKQMTPFAVKNSFHPSGFQQHLRCPLETDKFFELVELISYFYSDFIFFEETSPLITWTLLAEGGTPDVIYSVPILYVMGSETGAT